MEPILMERLTMIHPSQCTLALEPSVRPHPIAIAPGTSMKKSRAFSDRHMLRPFRSRNIPLLGCSSRTAPATQGLRRLESTGSSISPPLLTRIAIARPELFRLYDSGVWRLINASENALSPPSNLLFPFLSTTSLRCRGCKHPLRHGLSKTFLWTND
jgi:hypothetical protein